MQVLQFQPFLVLKLSRAPRNICDVINVSSSTLTLTGLFWVGRRWLCYSNSLVKSASYMRKSLCQGCRKGGQMSYKSFQKYNSFLYFSRPSQRRTLCLTAERNEEILFMAPLLRRKCIHFEQSSFHYSWSRPSPHITWSFSSCSALGKLLESLFNSRNEYHSDDYTYPYH